MTRPSDIGISPRRVACHKSESGTTCFCNTPVDSGGEAQTIPNRTTAPPPRATTSQFQLENIHEIETVFRNQQIRATQDGYGGGSYVNCSDPNAPGVASVNEQ